MWVSVETGSIIESFKPNTDFKLSFCTAAAELKQVNGRFTGAGFVDVILSICLSRRFDSSLKYSEEILRF